MDHHKISQENQILKSTYVVITSFFPLLYGGLETLSVSSYPVALIPLVNQESPRCALFAICSIG